jgi:hypothetical protein
VNTWTRGRWQRASGGARKHLGHTDGHHADSRRPRAPSRPRAPKCPEATRNRRESKQQAQDRASHGARRRPVGAAIRAGACKYRGGLWQVAWGPSSPRGAGYPPSHIPRSPGRLAP